MNLIAHVFSAFFGPSKARQQHRTALLSKATIESGLKELQGLCRDASELDAESPIFLLSAGWRSGSTLLQRLIMSDPNVLIWGEPYDECGIVQSLANTLTAFRTGWPPRDYYYSGEKTDRLTGEWIANLFPVPETLRRAHRAFFDTAFAEPARMAGASRWGIKEVRLDADHASYLRWLYPNARLVFLYRNPLDAYQSYCRYGRNWYDTWPDKPIFTPMTFGRHWHSLTGGFLCRAATLNALVVRYEDLAEDKGELLRRIEDHLNIRINPLVLGSKVGSSERGGEKFKVSRLEKALLRHAVSPLARDMGYDW